METVYQTFKMQTVKKWPPSVRIKALLPSIESLNHVRNQDQTDVFMACIPVIEEYLNILFLRDDSALQYSLQATEL